MLRYGFRQWEATCPACASTIPGNQTRCPRCGRRIERNVPVRDVSPEEQRRQRIILTVMMVLVFLYLIYTYVLAPAGAE